MKPIAFKESNITFVGRTKDIGDLPAWKNENEVVSCWQMSWRERFSALIFGRLWIDIWANGTQPPLSLSVSKEYFMQVHAVHVLGRLIITKCAADPSTKLFNACHGETIDEKPWNGLAIRISKSRPEPKSTTGAWLLGKCICVGWIK